MAVRLPVFLTYLLFCSLFVFTAGAQEKPSPVTERTVVGSVTDSAGNAVPGASVTLRSEKDSLVQRADDLGRFTFQRVGAAVFSVTVASLGYTRLVTRYRMNDTQPRLSLEPIRLKTEVLELDEVTVKTKVGVVFKTDTVEYTAADYDVPPYQQVGELIKQLEGIEVDDEGKITHMGKEIKRARLNGVDYFGGDIQTMIKELPADVASKIQVVDDYGDQARMTGIKKGEPEKVLNVVTKADRTAGKMYTIGGNVGTNSNFSGNGTLRHVDGAYQLGGGMNYNQRPAGIGAGSGSLSGGSMGSFGAGEGLVIGGGGVGLVSGGSGMVMGVDAGGIGAMLGGMGGSGGHSKRMGGDVSFANQWKNRWKGQLGYRFGVNDNLLLRNSTAQEYYQDGVIYSVHDSRNRNESQNHFLSSRWEFTLSERDRLFVNIIGSYNLSNSHSDAAALQSGVLRVDQRTGNDNHSTAPFYSADATYRHTFGTKGMNFSARLAINNNRNISDAENRNNMRYFDPITQELQKDSLLYTRTTGELTGRNYQLNTTFSYPVDSFSFVDISVAVHMRNNANDQYTDDIRIPGQPVYVDSLSRFFEFTFTESPVNISYRRRLAGNKFGLMVGMKAVSAWMQGYSREQSSRVNRNSLNLVPDVRLDFNGSKRQNMQLSYSGNVIQPQFEQVQPIRDVSDPLNPVVGNPDLKTPFRHNVNMSFNQYLTEQGISLMANVRLDVTQDKIVRNILLVEDAYQSLRRETRFSNVNGDYRVDSYYHINKSLRKKKYNLLLGGGVGFSNTLSMNNDLVNIGRTWNAHQRLGLRAKPVKWLDVIPNIRYSLNKTEFSLNEQNRLDTRNLAISTNLSGNFPGDWMFLLNAAKNFVSGINANVSNNPLVINTSVNKRFLKDRSMAVSLEVKDLLKQNNFVNRQVTDNGIVDSRSNVNSRMVLFELSWRPQLWRGGRHSGMPRSGDGSYIMD